MLSLFCIYLFCVPKLVGIDMLIKFLFYSILFYPSLCGSGKGKEPKGGLGVGFMYIIW